MDIEEILAKLDKVRANGRNKWMACCPAHADKSPSLSIGIGNNGAAVLNCFGGCSIEEICMALGVELHDLYPTDRFIEHTKKHIRQEAPRRPPPGRYFPQAELEEIELQIHFAAHFLDALEQRKKIPLQEAQKFLRVYENLQAVSGDLVDADRKDLYRKIGAIVIQKNRLFEAFT